MPLEGALALGEQGPCVVDEHVDRVELVRQLRGQRPDLLEVGEIGHVQVGRSLPVRSLISASALSPRERLRQTMCTSAPSPANASLAAAPMPELAPVTTTRAPSSRPPGSGESPSSPRRR